MSRTATLRSNTVGRMTITNDYQRSPKELVKRRVAVLVAAGSPAALPAKAATTVIPTVFMIGSDPVELGLVASLNHPGGNLTGVAYLNVEVAPKRLELLHQFVPAAKSIALLVNPANPVVAEAQAKELEAAVRTLGLHLLLVNASNPIEIEDAFAALVRDRVEALQIGVDPLFGNHVDQLVALATRHKVPTIYPWREFTAAGGLMNYGASIPDAFRQVGVYTGQILKGAKPGDLPVQRPTKLQFVLNLKAAKALGDRISGNAARTRRRGDRIVNFCTCVPATAHSRLWHIATNPKAQNLRSALMQSGRLWTSGLGRTCSE